MSVDIARGQEMNYLKQSRRGIILAGGFGTRLHPATQVVSKQLLTVFDKPMIYYPLTTMMLTGIKDLLLISTPDDAPLFSNLLGDGSKFGMDIQYAVQPRPEGIAQAFLLGKKFINGQNCALGLGDNIFYGDGFTKKLASVNGRQNGASLFAHSVNQPERYGVVELDANRQAISIQEKPKEALSNLAVTGLYFYDSQVCDIAETIKPSERGELEISSINNRYLDMGSLHVEVLGRGYTWFDAGTHNSLLDASNFIATIQKRQCSLVASPEEIAYRNGWIDAEQLIKLASLFKQNEYGQHLLKLVQ